MTPERWKAVGELFERAIALPAGERTMCVERASAGDHELRSEVFSLLASHKALPGGFVQEKIKKAVVAFHEANLGDARHAHIGPYRIIRELGRGGMGTVFLAEHGDREQVAIKLVRPGMDTEFILARFRRERQTLARMQHPNIARLLDSGTTNEGLPYIVMQYVNGRRITQHAQQLKLAIGARLVLFLGVCSAVDYAHRNFVIHRDIKPSNILVDSDDTPKLLDFGICKLLAHSPSDMTTADTIHGILMTPNYASPEQIRGEPVSLLSDVYSLGVVLWELLTDTCFSEVSRQSAPRLLGRFGKPVASTAVKNRSLRRQLSGDLDNILMCALELEPQRRYQSVSLLADDLRRHLVDEPIRARPKTMRYRTVKFINRHQALVVITAVVFVALAGSLAISLVKAHKADTTTTPPIAAATDPFPTETADALKEFRDSTAQTEELIGSQLQDASASPALYRALASQELGDLLNRRGDFTGASRAYAESASLATNNFKLGQPLFFSIFIASERKRALNAIALGQRREALELAKSVVDAAGGMNPGVAPLSGLPRAFSTMGIIYIELFRSPLQEPGDREQAIFWLRKSTAAWHELQGHPNFGAVRQREMWETEKALNMLENR
jgi:serine/threonine protein kinase